jgi:hypothetical protein
MKTPPLPRRRSTVRFTDPYGVVWEGEGETMAQAGTDLTRHLARGECVSLTTLGLLVLAAGHLELLHPEGCDDCPVCKTTLPLIYRALAEAHPGQRLS